MNSTRSIWKTTLVAALCIAMASCTLIRYDDNGDNGGNDNHENGPVLNDIPIDAPVIDALVMVDLDRGAANIMDAYYQYLALIEHELTERDVYIRNIAVAPLYRQQSQQPALLYGRGAPDNLSPDLSETLEHFVSQDGLAHLDGAVETPGENLAALGANLDRESIFNPETASEEGRAYFDEAEDGFVVFHLTGTTRACGHDDGDCALDGQPPAKYFTDEDGETGQATWLRLPGSTGLSVDDIAHISVVTPEGMDYETFVDTCADQPNFPMAYIDFLEPSEEHEYFGPKMRELDNEGGAGEVVDLCTAFSTRAPNSASRIAGEIARTVN